MSKKSEVILICARGGSKGIKNKNIVNFHGKPLIAYTINLSKKILNNSQIYVSSDSQKILKISSNYGITNLVRRNKKLALSNTPEILVWKDFIQNIPVKPDILIVIPTTSPLRSFENVNLAISKLKKNYDKYDTVICVTDSRKNPYFNMVKQKNKQTYKIVNKHGCYNRQSAPKVYDISTVCYVVKVKKLIKKNFNSIFDGKVGAVKIPFINSIDIDDIYDLEIAKYFFKKKEYKNEKN